MTSAASKSHTRKPTILKHRSARYQQCRPIVSKERLATEAASQPAVFSVLDAGSSSSVTCASVPPQDMTVTVPTVNPESQIIGVSIPFSGTRVALPADRNPGGELVEIVATELTMNDLPLADIAASVNPVACGEQNVSQTTAADRGNGDLRELNIATLSASQPSPQQIETRRCDSNVTNVDKLTPDKMEPSEDKRTDGSVKDETDSCQDPGSVRSLDVECHESEDETVIILKQKPVRKRKSKVDPECQIIAPKLHKVKSEGEVHFVQTGTPLKRFLEAHPMIQGMYLNRGKRDTKRALVTVARQQSAVDTGSWKRGAGVHERNRLDDAFQLTEEGQRRALLVENRQRRDEYVVNWYLWCPGHNNCRRHCGGIGKCLSGACQIFSSWLVS